MTYERTELTEMNHAACGVGLIAVIPQEGRVHASHQVVNEGLSVLRNFDYRSGFNKVTQESDGCGIKCFGLSSLFFNKKLSAGAFGEHVRHLKLVDNQFAIGQFFLSKDAELRAAAMHLIEETAKASGLLVLGWRNVESDLNLAILSQSARYKKPAMWQALIIDNLKEATNRLSNASLEMGLRLNYEAMQRKIPLSIVSLSSEAIIYKGMLKPKQMKAFYLDLQDEDFTATAVMMHSRFATNTNPEWSNAQPCVYLWAHNGELNSAPGNAMDMTNELQVRGFKGAFPNAKLSDSMQFDADLANQMAMHHIDLDEAFMRLMSPDPEDNWPLEIKAMLKYWTLLRTPYNGPAFAVAGMKGTYLAKLDGMGLRPSRWGIQRKKGVDYFMAASDDFLDTDADLICKGHLEPGGMILLTPKGELLHTEAILSQIAHRYHQGNKYYFHSLLQKKVLDYKKFKSSHLPWQEQFPSGAPLQQILQSAGWDYEAESQVVRHMAEFGRERTGAMGDDTNILHSQLMPIHHYFHQFFAQVSAPSLDSNNEADQFKRTIYLGAKPYDDDNSVIIELKSPILKVNELHSLEHNPSDQRLNALVLDTSFKVPDAKTEEKPADLLQNALGDLRKTLVKITSKTKGGILILSDRKASAESLIIPDLIALAVVKRFLEQHQLDGRFSIVADSYQIHGPHQATLLLALGAKAVYPRGAYAKILELFPKNSKQYLSNYRHALEKCLLKTMGKMGITDVNNYINACLVAAMGLDLSNNPEEDASTISLSKLFGRIYSPLKGIRLQHIAHHLVSLHQEAYQTTPHLGLLPRSGTFMPEKNGIKHGFGPVVVNAFTAWMKTESIRAILLRMHLILKAKGHPHFLEELSSYSLEGGFLDPTKKDKNGFYAPSHLNQFKASEAFKLMMSTLDDYRKENPTALHDFFVINPVMISTEARESLVVQSIDSILSHLYGGSMSQGALTVASHKTPHRLGAHETLTRGLNAVGAKSSSGEGGESLQDLVSPLTSTRSKQFASGRFGISALQILHAQEIEIKISQGAKPGEGGELPGTKVTIRFAAQRGGFPYVGFISPPPHHDIYSIEDLEQLIHDIKSVNPRVSVAVKLVASIGIGTIAAGCVKAGADVINIAAHSGGTGAAQQSSIKHAGLSSEYGLAEVEKALIQTRLRDLVKLRVSGGIKTVDEIIVFAILGADYFELGTSAMLTLGCKMLRACDRSCEPGVANKAELFKGEQINTERYFVNLAALIQERLKSLGFSSLAQLKGHFELLQLYNPKFLDWYDFSILLERAKQNPLSREEGLRLEASLQKKSQRPKEEALYDHIIATFEKKEEEIYHSEPIHLTTQDRSFGGRMVGKLLPYFTAHPKAKVVLNTTGNAGQSFGFVLSKGMTLIHRGSVQDGCAKSMTGGELVLITPNISEAYKAQENTIAGNAMLYGASGGEVYVNGCVGHRFGILMKGAEVVVEGTGDYPFEYMTSGTGMILGKVGKGIATGSLSGIVFVYDPNNALKLSNSVRLASAKEQKAYHPAIQYLLEKHALKTDSALAKDLLKTLATTLSHFKILIPLQMDKIKSLRQIVDVIITYHLRKAPLTAGLEVWLEEILVNALMETQGKREAEIEKECRELLWNSPFPLFNKRALERIKTLMEPEPSAVLIHTRSKTTSFWEVKREKPIIQVQVQRRLADISGIPDSIIKEPLQYLKTYIANLSEDGEGCSGCRAQSCSGGEVDTGCPAGKAINTINDMLKQIGKIDDSLFLSNEQWLYLRQAFEWQIETSPFIAYTGAACPAPCQDACTQTIPPSGLLPLKEGKPIGEAVHIKDIELALYLLGRALGWFRGDKSWTSTETTGVFGDASRKQAYEDLMRPFKPVFEKAESLKNKELIIIGSGPAGMQMAYQALKEGLRVRMYEQSDKPGGLLRDGIPAHKFDKTYLAEDFAHLQFMGLELYLNASVYFNEKTKCYCIQNNQEEIAISSPANEDQFIALCIGAGRAKTLDASLMSSLDQPLKQKVVQALDFLKAANDVAHALRNHSNLNENQKEALIKTHFGAHDPRHKKIVVLGGQGDTGQDVVRWVLRYLNQESSKGELHIIARGYKPLRRGVSDGYPSFSRAPTHENELKQEEINYMGANEYFLTELVSMTPQPNEKIKLTLRESNFKYSEIIAKDPELKELSDSLAREFKVIDKTSSMIKEIEGVDLILCALGFSGHQTNPLVQCIEEYDLKRVYLAGDAAGTGIIIGAQDNANKMFHQIRSAMGLNKPPKMPLAAFFKEKPDCENAAMVHGLNW